jgi:hypothetical protein
MLGVRLGGNKNVRYVKENFLWVNMFGNISVVWNCWLEN